MSPGAASKAGTAARPQGAGPVADSGALGAGLEPAATGEHRPHHAIAPSIATLAEVAEQPHGRIAPRIPALEEIRLIGGEHTVPEVAATFAPRKGGALEVALDCTQTHPHVLRDGRGRPPLAVQGPDLRMERLPAALALHGALLRREREVLGWHRHGHRPIREGYRLLVHQHIDRVECLAVRAGTPGPALPGDSAGDENGPQPGWPQAPRACAVAIGARPIPRDDLHPGVLPEPLATGSAVRSGSRATGCRRSRSTRIVP